MCLIKTDCIKLCHVGFILNCLHWKAQAYTQSLSALVVNKNLFSGGSGTVDGGQMPSAEKLEQRSSKSPTAKHDSNVSVCSKTSEMHFMAILAHYYRIAVVMNRNIISRRMPHQQYQSVLPCVLCFCRKAILDENNNNKLLIINYN